MSYDVGDIATVETELRDASDTPTAADVSLVVYLPGGAVLTPAPAVLDNGGVGRYRASFPLTTTGVWRYKWTASGALSAVDSGDLTVTGPGRLAGAASYIGASIDDPMLARLLDVAEVLVSEFLTTFDEDGVAIVSECPESIREHAVIQLTSELYSRRNNPNGVVWAPGGDSAARLSRDAMVSVLPLLLPYAASRGIA